MSHEAPQFDPAQPEREAVSAYQVFNLDAMTDDQILTTARAYYAQMDACNERGDRAGYDQAEATHNLLADDFARLAAQHTNRARGLVDRLLATPDRSPGADHDLSLAAWWSARIATFDFEYAKAKILYLRDTDDGFDSAVTAGLALEYYATPEQYADYRDAISF